VKAGLVFSLARPGGNATGLSIQTAELGTKWLEMLLEWKPTAKRVALLGPAAGRGTKIIWQSIRDAGAPGNVDVKLLDSSSASAVDQAFGIMAQE
jgi:putative ABC transport system substrate-binding protein